LEELLGIKTITAAQNKRQDMLEELHSWQSPLRIKHIMLILSMHQGGIQTQLNGVAGILVYL